MLRRGPFITYFFSILVYIKGCLVIENKSGGSQRGVYVISGRNISLVYIYIEGTRGSVVG